MSKRYLLPFALGLLLLAAAALLIPYYRQPHLILEDGHETTLRGRYATVAELVEAADIDLRPEDVVRPSLASSPPKKEAITIQHAVPVELVIDGQSQLLWTHQTNLASFLSEYDSENNLKLEPTTQVIVDKSTVPWSELADTQTGRTVTVSNVVDVTIHDGDKAYPLRTNAGTVGEALIEAGLSIYATDHIEPSSGAWLEPGIGITVERAAPVMIRMAGRQLDARTNKTSVAAILAEAGVGLVGRAFSSPALNSQLGNKDVIDLHSPTTVYTVTETPLPFASRLQALETLDIDQRALVQPGSVGQSARLMRVEVNGSQTLSPTLIGEWVSLPATDEIVGYGTNIVVRSLDTPDGPLSYWRVVRMRVSAYTAADAGRPPDHPAYGVTASGRMAGYGIVAIDPDVVPFRSQVYVPGYGVAFAGDTGGGVKGRWIDLGYNDGEIVAWKGYVDVYYLTPAPAPERINYLIPSALP